MHQATWDVYHMTARMSTVLVFFPFQVRWHKHLRLQLKSTDKQSSRGYTTWYNLKTWQSQRGRQIVGIVQNKLPCCGHAMYKDLQRIHNGFCVCSHKRDQLRKGDESIHLHDILYYAWYSIPDSTTVFIQLARLWIGFFTMHPTSVFNSKLDGSNYSTTNVLWGSVGLHQTRLTD